MDHGKFVLKNYLVNSIVELLSVPLPAALARTRNRFILLFGPQVKQIEETRMKLLKEFGDLDAEGNLVQGDDGNYKMKDRPAFTAAYETVMEANFALEVRGEQLVDFNTAFQILETLDTKLNVAQTSAYDEIMQAFEAWKNNGTN